VPGFVSMIETLYHVFHISPVIVKQMEAEIKQSLQLCKRLIDGSNLLSGHMRANRTNANVYSLLVYMHYVIFTGRNTFGSTPNSNYGWGVCSQPIIAYHSTLAIAFTFLLKILCFTEQPSTVAKRLARHFTFGRSRVLTPVRCCGFFFRGFPTPSHRGMSHITDKANAGSVSTSQNLPRWERLWKASAAR
jgi:hypothetical protein